MKWSRWLWPDRQSKERQNSEELERRSLQNELRDAKREWENALRHFDCALGEDHVDYAIYTIKAAEKRYEMLLRKAKASNKQWPAWVGEDAV
ncbi:DUF2508 family protein [Paenibacillus sp. GCM10027626]|uniref:DUF2508 family protein n=1 Tax=Paenibacillus sp. GCM10027626 TaxID=3273411 RepID=UPI00362570A0